MVIVNFWHLKNTNGMYWYALDYVRALGNVEGIYVRKGALVRLEQDLPGIAVHRLSGWQYVRAYLQLLFSTRHFLYTPTPHPLPLLRKQMVVLHDPYPFLKGVGHIKRWLFFVAACSAGCTVGVINRSVAERFVNPLRKRCNIMFAPNRIAEPLSLAPKKSSENDPLIVGLLGADSPKKRYEVLFEALSLVEGSNIRFKVYGHVTPYWASVKQAYPDIPVELLSSDEVGLVDFFDQVDCLVSVSKGEGFSRLIALAVVSGMSVFLIDDPVYREFYSGVSVLFESEYALLEQLNGSKGGANLNGEGFAEVLKRCESGWREACGYLNAF